MTGSSDLLLISSRSGTDPDLLEPESLVPPKNSNKVSSESWTPIATSGKSRRNKKKKKVPMETETIRYPEWTPDVSTYLNKPIKNTRKPRKKKSKHLFKFS
ncbi:hypothetical protein PGT21_016512, partial [Puccinia graminis f. sp. tritici]